MDLIEAMQTTNACRDYRPDPVADEQLYKVLDAARWAPTGSNKQPVRLLVVRAAEKRRQLTALYLPIWDEVMKKYADGQIVNGFKPGFLERVDHFARHMAEIPVMIVVCAALGDIIPPNANIGALRNTVGSSIYPAVQNMLLAARNEGLGTTLTTLLNLAEDDVKKILGIPAEISMMAMVTLGWPTKPFPKMLKRRPLSDMLYFDSYGQAAATKAAS